MPVSRLEKIPITDVNQLAVKLGEANTQKLSSSETKSIEDALGIISSKVLRKLQNKWFHLDGSEFDSLANMCNERLKFYQYSKRGYTPDYSFEVGPWIGSVKKGSPFDLEIAENNFARKFGYHYLNIRDIKTADFKSHSVHTLFAYVTAAIYSDKLIIEDSICKGDLIGPNKLYGMIRVVVVNQLVIIKDEIEKKTGQKVDWKEIGELIYNAAQQKFSFKDTVSSIYQAFGFGEKLVPRPVEVNAWFICRWWFETAIDEVDLEVYLPFKEEPWVLI